MAGVMPKEARSFPNLGKLSLNLVRFFITKNAGLARRRCGVECRTGATGLKQGRESWQRSE
jgi:hypothetical protein